MDGGPDDHPLGDNDRISILRVSSPWPARTKKALRASLDHGTFEDTHVIAPLGTESMERPMYFAGVVNEMVGASIASRKSLDYFQNKLVINDGSHSMSVEVHLSERLCDLSHNVGGKHL